MTSYHLDRVNHCPGCDRTHWWIGRITAQCAFCATAVPLAEKQTTHGRIIQRGKTA